MEQNLKLKGAMVANGTSQIEVARAMGLNVKTFYNKINRRTRNGCVVYFNENEKKYLSDRFGVAVTDIE